ncbi:carboxypeptidase regulatory-like domain-containing protein [Thiorhodococcus mannitoliphagus]|uniref:Carboxypeptidase regulatory-like domain-containing protein n=1 Tax=Thiorhodococcus mannitoliphagus TaxID=329406 RepID=A0A6P1DMQ5_9GAMM|nr:carboxypeptidase regulatory-like domain-containing protein [Thiorhodococcus mannitoliphagus]
MALTLAVSVYGSTLWAESGAMKPEPKRPEGVQTQWAIAPEGGEAPTTAYPEGTLLQKDITLPAGTLLPGGAVLPQSPAEAAPTDAPMSRSAVDLDAATGVPYISGGIGVSGREEMEGVKSKFNLRLLFAVKGSGAYLADVKVRIDDAAGPTLLTAVAQGPWFYADLAPGSYVLTVDNAGQTQSRDIQVPATGAVEQSFYWTD